MASKPAKVPRLHEDLLTCEICTDLITSAKNLSCGHTFCQECLEKWAQTNQNRKLTCPTCREPWMVPAGGIEKLPVNYVVNNIVGFVEANRKKSIGSGVNKCDFCEIKGAISACVECRQLACDTCTKGHKRTKTTSDHQVVSIEDYKANYENQAVQLKPGECDQHPGCQLKFFCQTCSIPICSDCTIIEHRVPTHHHIYLREAANKFQNLLRENLIKIKDKLKIFDEKEADIRGIKNMMTDSKDQVIVEVEKHTEDLLIKIQKNRREMIRRINNTSELKMHLFDSQLYKIEHGKSLMKSLIELSNKLLEPETDVSELMSTQERVKGLLDKEEELQVAFQHVTPYLHYSPDLVLEEGQIGKLQSLPLKTINLVGSRGSEPGQFKRPTGVVVSKDKEIFVADQGNKRIQVYDLNGQHKRHFTVHCSGCRIHPVDVSFTREGHLVIIDPDHKLVCICDTDGRQVRHIGVGYLNGPAGVAVSSDGHIHVAESNGDRVKVFTPEGGLVRTIRQQGNQPGQFNKPEIVAVNSKDQIIVCDFERVQVFDSSGTFLFTCGKEGELQYPCAVTVDQYDNIIVCDCSTGCIQIFSSEGVYIGRMDDPRDEVKGIRDIATVPGQPFKIILIEEDTVGHCKLRIISA